MSEAARPEAVSLESRLRPRAQVWHREVAGEIVAYDPHTETLHHLDGPATLTWRLLDGQRTLREVVAEIAAITTGAPAQILSDVVALAHRLLGLGLVDDATGDGLHDADAPAVG